MRDQIVEKPHNVPQGGKNDSRPPLSLETLIDIKKVKNLFEAFSQATGVATSIVSLHGDVLVACGWKKICTQFHRQHPESASVCVKNDVRNQTALNFDNGPAVYKCPFGIQNSAVPISIDGDHIANLFICQFFLEPPDAKVLEHFKHQATKWGYRQTAYLQTLSEVPVISESDLALYLHYLKQCAEIIGEMGLSHLRLLQKDDAIKRANVRLGHEMRLREEEAKKLSQILEANQIPTLVIDTEGRITHWNRACEILTGLPADKMIGTDKHQEAFYNERRPGMVDMVVKQASTYEIAKLYNKKFKSSDITGDGYQGEDFFPKLGKNGKFLFFTATPIKDSRGNITGAIETIQDITERRVAEEQVRNSETRYRTLFESANDAIFLLARGVAVDCNRKAAELLNCAREDIIGRTLLDFSTEYQSNGGLSFKEFDVKEKIISKNLPLVFDWRFRQTDSTPIDVEMSITRFNIFDTPYSIGIARDITERKRLVEALQKREKDLAEKTRYLEKVNMALKSALDNREIEKRSVEESILIKLKRFILPYIEELEKCRISTDAKAYVSIINTNMNDLISEFSRSVSAKYLDFTPTEVRIADLIRNGKNSKEIAEMIGMAPSSVQWHRKNIREKLDLTNKKINLQTYLSSLSK